MPTPTFIALIPTLCPDLEDSWVAHHTMPTVHEELALYPQDMQRYMQRFQVGDLARLVSA